MTRIVAIFVAVFAGIGSPAKASLAETAPVLPRFDAALSKRFAVDIARANKSSMNKRAFSKVGDSNTAALSAFYGLGCRRARLDGRHHLAGVIDRHKAKAPGGTEVVGAPSETECPSGNSFTRRSLATRSASSSELFILPVSEVRARDGWVQWFYPDERCDLNETMVACEIRSNSPRYTFVAVGTNDLAYRLPMGAAARSRIGLIVDDIRHHGSVPVLLTPPPLVDLGPGREGWDFARDMAGEIVRVGRTKGVPVVNVWKALTSPNMINYGLRWDGIHVETFGDAAKPGALTRSVDFRRPALKHGNNRRNLLLLQTLYVLDKQVRE